MSSYRGLGEAEKRFAAGLALHKQREYQKALSEFNEAIRLAPQLAKAYIRRGVAYDNLGEHQLAMSDHNEAIRLYSQDAMPTSTGVRRTPG